MAHNEVQGLPGGIEASAGVTVRPLIASYVQQATILFSLSCTTSLSPALSTTPSLLLLTSYVTQRLRLFFKVYCERLWLERVLYCFVKKVISSDEQRMVA